MTIASEYVMATSTLCLAIENAISASVQKHKLTPVKGWKSTRSDGYVWLTHQIGASGLKNPEGQTPALEIYISFSSSSQEYSIRFEDTKFKGSLKGDSAGSQYGAVLGLYHVNKTLDNMDEQLKELAREFEGYLSKCSPSQRVTERKRMKTTASRLIRRKLNENVDMYTAIQQWCNDNNVHSWEGSRGVRAFSKLCADLGYGGYGDPIHNFLEDNMGCMEAMTEWMIKVDRGEWAAKIGYEEEEEEEEPDDAHDRLSR